MPVMGGRAHAVCLSAARLTLALKRGGWSEDVAVRRECERPWNKNSLDVSWPTRGRGRRHGRDGPLHAYNRLREATSIAGS